jgi:hypothetical protein
MVRVESKETIQMLKSEIDNANSLAAAGWQQQDLATKDVLIYDLKRTKSYKTT